MQNQGQPWRDLDHNHHHHNTMNSTNYIDTHVEAEVTEPHIVIMKHL